MDLFLAISQGIGVSLAAGLRAFVAALVVGLLAVAGVGVDFDGTDFEFLQSAPWLAAMAVLAVASTVSARGGRRVPPVVMAVAAAVIGALLFAGTLADEGRATAPGLVAGAAVGLLGFAAGHAFLSGAGARLSARGEAGPASLLALYADLAAAVVAALAVLLPPVSYVPLALAAWALVARRRRAQRKYEGLRVLR